MEKQERSSTPSVLLENQKAWTEKYVQGGNWTWHQSKGKPVNQWLYPVLREQTKNHCSFCDQAPMSAQSRETIEHFRPKGAFRELAYEWSNLFYCCDRCQQKSASKEFEEQTVKPDERGYTFQRYFTYIFATGEIEVNRFSSSQEQERAQALINRYELNETDLVNARQQRYEDYLRQGDQARPAIERPYRFCYLLP